MDDGWMVDGWIDGVWMDGRWMGGGWIYVLTSIEIIFIKVLVASSRWWMDG